MIGTNLGKKNLFVLSHGLFRNCTQSLARLFLLAVAAITQIALNLTLGYLHGKIPCISLYFTQWEVSVDFPRSILLLKTNGLPLGRCHKASSQVCSNANLSTVEEAPAV